MTTERVIDRRTVLKAGALAAGAAAAPMLWARAGARGAAPRARLTDVEHVVILMQENRSFDHYFGTLRGVRGFSDPHAVRSVFRQFDPDLVQNPQGYVLPYRFDTTTTSGQSAHDLSHAWSAQHYSWNNGLMDGFVAAHRLADDIIDRIPPIPVSDYGPLTMGYFTRADIPFHYALADAFTICDGYHCSVFGPTNPNRIMAISGTIDAEGAKGGPCIDNSQSNGQLRWTTYPERLHAAGISWRFYQEADNDTNNMLPFFRAYTNASQISRRANTVIPTPHGQRYGPALAARLKADVLAGELPQVSWILASSADCEHPSATPGYGARFVASILDALTADPRVWAKTAVFYTFDENDGFFDHVTPPTPPPGTAGEYLPTSKLLSDFQSTLGWTGPVGLGFRVPMIVMSPWTRGGRCCSDVFDHTSILLFLEKRFGVEVPNISAWRRATVGDLTEAFNFAGGADPSLPKLPDANHLAHEADLQASRPPPRIPSRQIIPAQELGPPRPKPRE